MAKQLFLSYAHEDRDAAAALARATRSLGYDVWWDHQLLPAENFRAAIRQQLDDADCVVVLWTATSVGSQWVIDEAERASQAGKLVPIILGGLAPGELPIGLGRQHIIIIPNASATEGDEFKRQLVEAMTISPDRRRGPDTNSPRANLGVSALRAASLLTKAYVYSFLFVRTAMNMLTQDYNDYLMGFDGRLPPDSSLSRAWMLQDEDGADVWTMTAITAGAFIGARLLHGLNFKGSAAFSLARPGASNLFTERSLIAFVGYIAFVAAPFAGWHYFHPDFPTKVPWWWAAEQLLVFLWLFPWLWLAVEGGVHMWRSVWAFLTAAKRRAI